MIIKELIPKKIMGRLVCVPYIYIHHNFMRDMSEKKDMNIKYIRSEENLLDVMMNNQERRTLVDRRN